MSAFSEDDLHEDPEDIAKQTLMLNKYCFWYHKRHQKIGASAYEESITQIASFQTIEHFWRVYDHLIRVNDVKTTTDFHLFKHGIKPTWEDPQNEKGGKWMIRLKKGLSSRYWEDIILAIIGEQFDVGHEICGAVISVRAAEDILSVWNKNSDNLEAKNKIRDQLKKLLRLPAFVTLEYKVHRDSLTDGSSFRNTTVWRPSHAPRGASWNSGDGSGDTSSKMHQASNNIHRSHTTQPPGGVVGDGNSWGSRQRQHQSAWKSDTSHSGVSTPMISPIVSSLGDVAPADRSWGKSSGGTGGCWARMNSATTTPSGGGFQHKGHDDERGGNYGDITDGQNQKMSRYSSAGSSDAGKFPPRRRFDTSGQSLDGQGSVGEVKKRSTTADQARVWGRAQTIVADPAPEPASS